MTYWKIIGEDDGHFWAVGLLGTSLCMNVATIYHMFFYTVKLSKGIAFIIILAIFGFVLIRYTDKKFLQLHKKYKKKSGGTAKGWIAALYIIGSIVLLYVA